MIEIDNSSNEIMTDLMMVVLIIFLLIVVALSLDVHNKINIVSKDNTFSGGRNQPALIVSPIKYSNGCKIAIYPQSILYSRNKNSSVIAISPASFAGLLSFIDYGEINDKGKKRPLLNLHLYGAGSRESISYKDNHNGENGVLDPQILESMLSTVWPDYQSGETNQKYFFNVTKRAKVYFETDIFNSKKSIIIGHYVIDLSEGSMDSLFILNTLSTSVTDFIYIGEFNKTERIDILRQNNGDMAAAYYDEWSKTGHLNNLPAPFVKYPKARHSFLEQRQALNITPPQWAMDLFLDKVGANLKIISTKKTIPVSRLQTAIDFK